MTKTEHKAISDLKDVVLGANDDDWY